MEDIQCIFESMSARGSIYISNLPAAQNISLLREKGIKAVLSVARSGLLNHKRGEIDHYLYLPIQDRQDFQIIKHFDTTYDFIDKARKQTNVLIHCIVGVSRSVTIAIAYLLKKYKYTLSQVINLIQRKRKKINPNPGFIDQLKKYSEQLGIKADFFGRQVPHIRESSNSRQKRNHSAKIQRNYNKMVEQLSPICHIQKENSKQKTNQSQLIYNDDGKNATRRHFLELKKFKSFEQKPTYAEQPQQQRKVVDDIKQKLVVKKQHSVEQKSRKRLSIQEKISQIREKMLKTQHNYDSQAKRQSPVNSLNRQGLKQQTKIQKKYEKSLFESTHNQYYQKHSTPPKMQISSERSKLHVNHQTTSRRNDVLNYCKQEKNRQLFNTDLRIESKTFYSNGYRPSSRFNMRGKEQIIQ